jgi:hypothetical protein
MKFIYVLKTRIEVSDVCNEMLLSGIISWRILTVCTLHLLMFLFLAMCRMDKRYSTYVETRTARTIKIGKLWVRPWRDLGIAGTIILKLELYSSA